MSKLEKVFSESFQRYKGSDLIIYIDENEKCQVLTIENRKRTYEILDDLQARGLNCVWEQIK